ncbi:MULTISPECIES: chemotaxis protein [Telluria group]|uniref:Two-component system chemotaxis response regulator CheV n=1 Tax=Pseudoduganella violacea TaxID=1715466 RepID=A0A7W5BDA3_9BURK|nr:MULTISPECIES: chemotaxis protein [Telluria group]MBB3120730.1 two-component system chemotaxis response regulator CheV [Pseudoduganella violacea]NVD99388.1 chemotaxis protein CheV [Massilia sp. BJB1822]UTY59044.1 chemotaxis protein CheV [Massilia sp. erpn]
MNSVQQEVDERSNLTNSNKFELLLFRLGADENGDHSELYGINVFKIREIVAMPQVTAVAGSPSHTLGVVNLRGQIITVLDLPAIVGVKPKTGLNIMLVTEFARTTQAFAVESVDEIVRLDWSQVLSAENSNAGGMVTSIARLDGDVNATRLAQVLDVETILRKMVPTEGKDVDPDTIGPKLGLKPGTFILAADDSVVARNLIERGLEAMGAPFVMTKTGKEAWEKLQHIADGCKAEGIAVDERVALVLTDLEMPEMDGFTLTRMVKQDPRFSKIPVVIHSSLSGKTNEDHVKGVGADAYVAKFVAEDLAETIRKVLHK